MGREALLDMQNKYYNKSLADMLMKKIELKKYIEVDGEIIQKKDPVFMKPVSRFARAQLYTPEKSIFNFTIKTFIFNILIIWLGTFILYIALLKSWLKYILSYIEHLIMIRKRKKRNAIA